MLRCSSLGIALILLSGCKNPVEETPVTPVAPSPYDNYSLVWHDEFDGTSLDLSRWGYETGTGVNGDFGTGQLDRATNRTENIAIVQNIAGADGNVLGMTTRKERYIDREYTSSRITTSGKASWGPGHRIEARIKASGVRSKGQGFAFWMMPAEKPADQAYLMWPQGGEIDIMEFVGSFPYHNLGSVHYAWSWNKNEYADWNHGHKGAYLSFSEQQMPASAPVYTGIMPTETDSAAGSGQFRTYGIEWFTDRMEFYVDAAVYHVHYFRDGYAFDHGIPDGQDEDGGVMIGGKRRMLSEYSEHFPEWYPFAHQFFIILSAGVGGSDSRTYGGAVIPEAQFPCTVYIDWVRVYKRQQ